MQFETARIHFTSDVCASLTVVNLGWFCGDAVFPLFSGSFSHHVKIYSFMFMHKVSNRVVFDGLVTDALFFLLPSSRAS